MFYRAFKQYVANNFKENYSLFSQVETVAFAGLCVALTIDWLIVHHLLTFSAFHPYVVCAVLFVIYALLLPIVRTFVGALWYSAKFYGPYEIIERYWGYRAFRITREDQEIYGQKYEGAPIARTRIIASAIQNKDGTIWCVLKPGRHHHCIAFMAEHGANKQEHRQGFLTNHYRFIGREEAHALAQQNGQATNPAHGYHLFSEDLWDTPSHLQYKG